MELDLTEATDAGGRELLLAWYAARDRPDDINGFDAEDRAAVADNPDAWCLECSGVGPAALAAATLAVRAAAPIIERAVLERAAADILDKRDHLRTRKPHLADGASRAGGLEEAAWIVRNGPDEFVLAARAEGGGTGG